LKKYKNKFEEKLGAILKRKQCKFEYEGTKLSYLLTGHYTPDFTIQKKDGEVMFIEAKGYFQPERKRVMAAVKKLHPAIDLRLVFYRLDKKNIRWAEKHKMPWAIETIPREWIEECR
jgi:predicted nuclease of restriction endonuclease-like RecB superfamily